MPLAPKDYRLVEQARPGGYTTVADAVAERDP